MMLVLLLFMHLLVVDYIIVIIFCTMFQGVKRTNTKTSESMCAHLDKIATYGTYYPSFENVHWLKIQHRIIYKI